MIKVGLILLCPLDSKEVISILYNDVEWRDFLFGGLGAFLFIINEINMVAFLLIIIITELWSIRRLLRKDDN